MAASISRLRIAAVRSACGPRTAVAVSPAFAVAPRLAAIVYRLRFRAAENEERSGKSPESSSASNYRTRFLASRLRMIAVDVVSKAAFR
jgi:hypothetical protein